MQPRRVLIYGLMTAVSLVGMFLILWLCGNLVAYGPPRLRVFFILLSLGGCMGLLGLWALLGYKKEDGMMWRLVTAVMLWAGIASALIVSFGYTVFYPFMGWVGTVLFTFGLPLLSLVALYGMAKKLFTAT